MLALALEFTDKPTSPKHRHDSQGRKEPLKDGFVCTSSVTPIDRDLPMSSFDSELL